MSMATGIVAEDVVATVDEGVTVTVTEDEAGLRGRGDGRRER
jgi:hypothetical protein